MVQLHSDGLDQKVTVARTELRNTPISNGLSLCRLCFTLILHASLHGTAMLFYRRA
uniref:Uncharacterized protein n=1 Tax=Triticum urartu TaxID=4572 RepID=A0A8R7K4H2_TRIUA